MDEAEVKKLDSDFKKQLQERLDQIKQTPLEYKPQKIEEEWDHLRRSKPEDFDRSPDTSISEEMVNKVAKAITEVPKGFQTAEAD